MNIQELAKTLSYEELASALYLKGDMDGFHKVTDKTKWREPVMAEKLGHKAHTKISAVAGTDEYGSDALDLATGKMAEYKSNAITDKEKRNLLEEQRSANKRFTPLKVSGVYNGAYSHEAIDSYSKNDHYFGVFYKEQCVLIIKPHTEYVIETLRANLDVTLAKLSAGTKTTTNLNTVTVDLADKSKYSIAYINTAFMGDFTHTVLYEGV